MHTDLVWVHTLTFFILLLASQPQGQPVCLPVLAIQPNPQKHWQGYSLLLSSALACKLGRGCWLARGFSCCSSHKMLRVCCHHHDQLPAHQQHQQHQHRAVRAANGRVKYLELDHRWWEVIGIFKPSCQNQIIFQMDKPKSSSGLIWSWAARMVIGTLPMSSDWNVEDETANNSSNPARFRDLIREIKQSADPGWSWAVQMVIGTSAGIWKPMMWLHVIQAILPSSKINTWWNHQSMMFPRTKTIGLKFNFYQKDFQQSDSQ